MLPEMEDAMKSEELGLSSFQGLDHTKLIAGNQPEIAPRSMLSVFDKQCRSLSWGMYFKNTFTDVTSIMFSAISLIYSRYSIQ